MLHGIRPSIKDLSHFENARPLISSPPTEVASFHAVADLSTSSSGTRAHRWHRRRCIQSSVNVTLSPTHGLIPEALQLTLKLSLCCHLCQYLSRNSNRWQRSVSMGPYLPKAIAVHSVISLNVGSLPPSNQLRPSERCWLMLAAVARASLRQCSPHWGLEVSSSASPRRK